VEVAAEDVANMFVAYESCTFVPDTSSHEAYLRGDGDLVVDASVLAKSVNQDMVEATHGNKSQGFLAPVRISVERAPGVVVNFTGGGQVYHGNEFIGWSYWEDDETYDSMDDCPCVNFKILAK
jgi:hypothetical protein